jgi:riboflavin synthase
VAALEAHDATESGGGGTSMTILDCGPILEDAHLGDSISVNGTCLTITELTGTPPTSFKLGISPETLRRTNLGDLTQGSKVNLERAVSATTRIGGHFVQGHVDTIAEIIDVKEDGNAKAYRLRPRDPQILRYVVEKGYVTLDGASLTVTEVEDGDRGWFGVMLIAYTQERIVMARKGVGEKVNVEVDMVGKYVEKSVQGYFASKGGDEGNIAMLEKMVKKIVDEKLQGR